uniref:Uncharacterized protein n=1 Tax=Arundo donax TaxID=35708 RepID=A0A0A9E371_ARUDO
MYVLTLSKTRKENESTSKVQFQRICSSYQYIVTSITTKSKSEEMLTQWSPGRRPMCRC